VERRDLRQTIADAVRLVDRSAQDAEVALSFQVPDEPVYVEHDATQIQQVLVNLLLNGLQAMDPGGALQVRLRSTAEAAAISVQDNGAGLTPAHMSRIFEPFFTTRPNAQGRGLGLAVSQAIVSAHHGRMDVASRPGDGSTFTVWLPSTQPPRPGQEAVP
jgi:signal transduction histidine kinase